MTQTPHATMNTLLRFWSDIDNVTRAPYQAIQNDILEYLKWVQSEKARADAAEEEVRYQKGVTEDYAKGYRLQELCANAAEAREQRLKENIEFYIPHMWPAMSSHFKMLLASLYPDTPAPPEP